MKKLTAHDPETQSADLIADNLQQLKALFPEACTEGKIDFEVLKQLLGGAVEEREEKYGLNWHGKRRARQLALTPSTGTLRPCPEDSVDWDTTRNLMIEGDNLEVLKLLQKSYAGKVKLIYIDPPYNTGKDFIYPDDYRDNIRNYLELTGQVEGRRKISSNTEASGRFHTDWLNMMYPRLKLARNLLKDDGVIFISIDDNEVANFLLLIDEVFGGENLIEVFTWHKKNSAKGVPPKNMVVNIHEYILCYSKNQSTKLFGEKRTEDTFSNPDNDPRGLWRRSNIKSTLERPKDKFTIVDPTTGNEFANYWAFSKETLNKMIDENRIIFPKYTDGLPKQKEFINEFSNPNMPVKSHLGLFDSQDTSEKEIDDMMNDKFFLYRKPIKLIKKIIEQGGEDEYITIDFFSGSSTTAQAVLELNREDGGNRRFIMVQLPEPTPEDSAARQVGYNTIADIGKERIRRAAKKIKDENPLFAGDLGFRVFKLDSSNIRAWEPDRDNLPQSLLDATDHLKADRSEQDILFELLLKLGLDLTIPIEKKIIAGKTVHSIGAGVLLVCLAPQIAAAEVEPLALGLVDWHKELAPVGDSQLVFRDSAFADDVAKTNLTAILQQHGLDNVRSL